MDCALHMHSLHHRQVRHVSYAPATLVLEGSDVFVERVRDKNSPTDQHQGRLHPRYSNTQMLFDYKIRSLVPHLIITAPICIAFILSSPAYVW